MRSAILLAPLLAAACGETVQDNHFADDIKEERPVSGPVRSAAVPVRVGELGPSFPACGAAGTTRNVPAGAGLPVRAAPFDTADEAGSVPAGSRFFICTRSHDQKWFGIVYDAAGASQSCGVSEPASSRRNYQGPCSSGWVSSAFVRLTAGVDQAAPQVAESDAGNAS
ncbi:MAG TPA: hypothetical protein VGD10_09600 [Allosphingosinicella sp.]|uniref:hypothetical protein n=1 Tax=Allosphingosinicella sp. TaxID=2823234 RepID=UPI002EDB74AD